MNRQSNMPARFLGLSALVCGIVLAAMGCQRTWNAPQVVKVGVIGPFEGTGRALGYAALEGIRSELAASNARRTPREYRIALVALNDDLSSEAAADQAKALASDLEVLGVIGLWSDESARAAAPVLADAGLPALSLGVGDSSESGVLSLCPPPHQVAAEILRMARGMGERLVLVTGPDTPLKRALADADPGLIFILDSASSPCPGGAVDDCLVVHTGDAEGAGAAQRRWRAAGWRGTLLGGPDVARPWFIGEAGIAAEGARAVVCDRLAAPVPGQDASLQAAVNVSSDGVRLFAESLARDTIDGGRPSRQGVAGAMLGLVSGEGLSWIEVKNGSWVPLLE